MTDGDGAARKDLQPARFEQSHSKNVLAFVADVEFHRNQGNADLAAIYVTGEISSPVIIQVAIQPRLHGFCEDGYTKIAAGSA